MHPLDVVKTRFQIQTSGSPGDPNYYTSVYDCIRKMARNEGILSLYKGVLPPVLVETPKRGVKVICQAWYVDVISCQHLCQGVCEYRYTERMDLNTSSFIHCL